ncbi:MAG: proprotein convertase P-domain-containing protein, partial [Bacteroidota bacterium]
MVKATFTLKSACQYCLAVLFMTALSLSLSAQITSTFSGAGLPADVGTLDGGVTLPAGVTTSSDATVNFGFPAAVGLNATLDRVVIDVTHTWIGDLDVTLVSPAGTSIQLVIADIGDSDDNFTGTTFEDGGGDINADTAPYTGVYAPESGQTFAATFAGEDINGDWSLVLLDNFGGDTGTFNSFDITFTAEDTTPNDCPFVDNEVACIANVNVTLGETCSAVITPSMVLAGVGVDCAENITITTDGGNSNMIFGCGEHTYMATVTDALGNVTYTCWGNIFAEDKTDPTIECPDDVDEIAAEFDIQMTMGTIDATDPTIELADYSCFLSLFDPVAGPYGYDLLEISVSATDVYNIIVDGDVADQTFISVYAGDFNPDNPCENILGGTEGAWAPGLFFGGPAIFNFFNQNFRIPLILEPGQTYTIMVASNDLPNDYTVGVVSDNGSTVSGAGFGAPAKFQADVPLYCEDTDLVLFDTPQSWVVTANGMLDATATRALNGWTQSELN